MFRTHPLYYENVSWNAAHISRESGNPRAPAEGTLAYPEMLWIPAFAGKTSFHPHNMAYFHSKDDTLSDETHDFGHALRFGPFRLDRGRGELIV